jgi:uncharacterized protein YndB with AHSA1/START domain
MIVSWLQGSSKEGDAVTNESILISEVIPASPQRIFSAWMDSAEHSAFTGDEATVVPKVGGEHRAAGGYIQGRTLELNEGSRIVQSWRTTEFPPESPDSRVEITLEPTLGGTLVTLLHTDIPVGQGDRYRQSWNDYYLSRLKTYFSDADDDDDETSPVSSVVASAGGRIVSLEVDLDEETAVGDLEPTSVAETPTKVMRTNVKRALAASTRGGAAAHTGDTKTVRVTRAAAAPAGAGAGKSKPARAATKKAAKVAARRPAKAAKKPMKKAAKAAARRPAKPVKKVAARRAAKPVKKAAAKVSRKPAKKAARPAANAKRLGAKRKGGAKR